MKADLRLLNTRPEHQSKKLTELVESIGGSIFNLPLFEIQPLQFEKPNLSSFNYLIFLSANAVNAFFSGDSEINIKGEVIAIGSATQRALKNKNIQNVICPMHFSSEGILSIPALQNIDQKTILIVCGENSKSLLPTTFTARGAQIKIMICYRRILVSHDMEIIFPQLVVNAINTVVATSFESLSQLVALFHAPKHNQWLMQKKLCVVNEKMKMEAIHMGFQSVMQSKDATDESILAAIQY